MSLHNQIVIAGTSITNDVAWPTWATWIKKAYKFSDVTDVSARGIGNEVILLKAVHAAKTKVNPILFVQLTSIDKWDWYVQDHALMSKIQQQKHPGELLNANDEIGFWSTGSHFPLWKDYYKQNYYSQDYHAFKTLLSLQWFTMLCDNNKWKYVIIFESPILAVTEQQLNLGQIEKNQCYDKTLIENSLCSVISDQLDISNIYLPGLIGYACLNDLPWYDKKFKSHPGSYVHYCFARDVLSNSINDMTGTTGNFSNFEKEAIKFQKLINSQ